MKSYYDGTIERYKAHLVAKGFTQKYGIDYEETFALVACVLFVCSLIVVAIVHQQKLFQMDVKNALINGDFPKNVYMKLPHCYSHPLGKV